MDLYLKTTCQGKRRTRLWIIGSQLCWRLTWAWLDQTTVLNMNFGTRPFLTCQKTNSSILASTKNHLEIILCSHPESLHLLVQLAPKSSKKPTASQVVDTAHSSQSIWAMMTAPTVDYPTPSATVTNDSKKSAKQWMTSPYFWNLYVKNASTTW